MAVPEDVLPFREFVLKVHSRCDLACDHCYVYEHADQSWRTRPVVMPQPTVQLAAERIAQHARQQRLPGVRVVLHGGEPLLAGVAGLSRMARALREAIEPACALDLRVHTNGVRLNEEFCELFRAERIKVGISLDGNQAANDLHRKFANGRSSYPQVLRAVRLLRQERYRECYAGLLCTIDIRSDPVAVYRALRDLDPPAVDFLLPHATWDSPPPGAVAGTTPYADWLALVFDAWRADGSRVSVRTFDSIIATTLGGPSQTEALGLEPSDLLVIETDGALEQADSLKVAFDGAPATGLNLADHQLSAAASDPGIRARQSGLEGLSATCRQCPVVTSCGGGLYAHRYRSGSGFDNPSVYCGDLKQLITHVGGSLRAAVTATEQHPVHQLTTAAFDELSAGLGDEQAIGQLAAAQRSRLRTLLQMLSEHATGPADAGFLAGWDLLARVERHDASAFGHVIAHPYLRRWAEHCLRAAGPAAAASGSGVLTADAGYLGAIAASAAIRAGLSAEIGIPVTGGYACLPSLGRLRVGRGPLCTVTVADDGFEARTAAGKWRVRLADPAADDDDWEPVRQLRSGQDSVWLEDTDPYRDCHQWPVTGRLSTAEADRWQQRFAVAWPLIERVFPGYLTGLRAGLSTVLPLACDELARDLSASSRQAFAAIGVALPADGDTLALLLLHEFQHVKLGALLDMFDLCDNTDRRLFYVPWREEPRPIEALCQGAYAHLAVTDFWRVQRHELPGERARAAAEKFARWRVTTAEAIETILASGTLTALGERFASGMRATVQPWLDEPVPWAAAEAARTRAAEHRARWQRGEWT